MISILNLLRYFMAWNGSLSWWISSVSLRRIYILLLLNEVVYRCFYIWWWSLHDVLSVYLSASKLILSVGTPVMSVRAHVNDLILANYTCCNPVSEKDHILNAGGETSTYEFKGDTIQPVAMSLSPVRLQILARRVSVSTWQLYGRKWTKWGAIRRCLQEDPGGITPVIFPQPCQWPWTGQSGEDRWSLWTR